MSPVLNTVKAIGRLLLLLVGCAALYAYAMFQGGFVSWFLFYSFSPFMIYAASLFIYPLRLLKVERIIEKDMYEAGDSLTYHVRISQRFPFPFYFLLIEDTLAPSLNSESCKVILFPWFRTNIQKTFVIDNVPRGEHALGNLKISTADFLGFIKKEQSTKLETRVVVYPKIARINLFAMRSQQDTGVLAEGFEKQETLVPASVREYMPGDKFSWINWKMTARKNSPMTKEFEQSEDQCVFVMMDRNREINDSVFEKIVHHTASILNELYRNGILASFTSIGSDKVLFQTKRAEITKKQLFYHLATVGNNSPLPFSTVLDNECGHLPSNGTLLFITDRLTDDLEHVLKKVARRPYKIVVFVVSKENKGMNTHRLRERNITISVLADETEPIGVRNG